MSTGPFYVPPTYEDVELKYESKETPESHLLLVHIPDGFAREHIGAKVEFDLGRVRVFGERPLGNNRSSRFNLVYQVPASCDLSRIKGKLEGGIVTITMTKKVISKEELPPTEQEAPKSPDQETEPSPEKDQEGIPSQSTTEDDQEKTTVAEENDQKGQEGISDQDPKSTVESKEEADHETSTLPEATEESIPQKGQENVPQKATFAADAKLQKEEKFAGPTTDENGEKQTVGKEEIKEDVVDDSPITEKESNEERKESAVDGESTLVPKTTEKEKEKEINGKFGADADKGSYVRIREMAASATQAVTSLARRFNEEDKQKLIYMGAAVGVVALGVYASYKLRSSPRH